MYGIVPLNLFSGTNDFVWRSSTRAESQGAVVHFLVVACCIFGDIQFDLCHHLIYLTGLKEARFSLDAIAWNPINKQHSTHLFPTFRSFFLHHLSPFFFAARSLSIQPCNCPKPSSCQPSLSLPLSKPLMLVCTRNCTL